MGSIVYHYTDTQAFAGVVQNAALWATDFRYLNDSRELRYAWDPFVAKLRRLSKEPGEYSEAYKAQLKALELMNMADLMNFDDSMFVACFTELRDAVSQWSRYGANGHGIALGFDSEAIRTVDVPSFHHNPKGQLTQMTALTQVSGDNYKRQLFTSKGFLQKVGYGDEHRDRVVDDLIDHVETICENNGVGPFNHKVGNSIFQTHALVHRLPLVKHDAFEDEEEHRITITEHLGGKSLMQLKALSTLDPPFTDVAQGALETLDVRFRPGGPTMFKPYVVLPFDHAALVEVVTGPAIKHQLVEATVRRMLDRNGFRDTEIEASGLPYQT